MPIAPISNIKPLEEDLITNIRIYKINEMVYQKGEPVTDKFTTVFNTLSTYNASVFILLDSDGIKTDFYLGVRNNESDNSDTKRSTVTLGDTLKNTLVGHFPGIKMTNEDRHSITNLSDKILNQTNVASVSVVGNSKNGQNQQNLNEQFVQGLEKLALAMQGRQYTGIIIAQNKSSQSIEMMRKNYQEMYTKLSPLQKIQTSDSDNYSVSRNKSYAEMTNTQKLSLLGQVAPSMVGAACLLKKCHTKIL